MGDVTQFDFEIDYYKVQIDLIKHTTTLAAGMLVVTATFHDKLSAHAEWKWLIFIATLSFLSCILCAVWTYFICANIVKDAVTSKVITNANKKSDEIRRQELDTHHGTVRRKKPMLETPFKMFLLSFTVGMICFSLFIVLNIWNF